MNVINKTGWNTHDLRAIITRVIQMEMDDSLKRKLPHFRVEIGYTRRSRLRSAVKGWAYYHGSVIKINLPYGLDSDNKPRTFLVSDFAFVVAHELAHSRGVHHRQMGDRYRWRGVVKHWSWADQYTVRWDPIVKSKPVDLRSLRYERAVANLKRARTRLKRALTIAKRWTRTVKYYERLQAASAAKEVTDETAE